MIVVVPAATPVAIPVLLPIVAIVLLPLVHTPPLTVLPSVVVDEVHTVDEPDIAEGCTFTVKAIVLAVPHPVE